MRRSFVGRPPPVVVGSAGQARPGLEHEADAESGRLHGSTRPLARTRDRHPRNSRKPILRNLARVGQTVSSTRSRNASGRCGGHKAPYGGEGTGPSAPPEACLEVPRPSDSLRAVPIIRLGAVEPSETPEGRSRASASGWPERTPRSGQPYFAPGDTDPSTGPTWSCANSRRKDRDNFRDTNRVPSGHESLDGTRFGTIFGTPQAHALTTRCRSAPGRRPVVRGKVHVESVAVGRSRPQHQPERWWLARPQCP